jgi:beta-galactosidase
VLAYTSCDAVELYLNGKFIAEKRLGFPLQGTSGDWNHYARPLIFPTTVDLHLSWDVPYQPGVLRAVGKCNGEVLVVEEVCTAGAPATLCLSVDRGTILANIRDVAHVKVEVVDFGDLVVLTADIPVRFSLQGPG